MHPARTSTERAGAQVLLDDIAPNAVPAVEHDAFHEPLIRQCRDAGTGRPAGAAPSCRSQAAGEMTMLRFRLPARGDTGGEGSDA
jgi:hypothetical protein